MTVSTSQNVHMFNIYCKQFTEYKGINISIKLLHNIEHFTNVLALPTTTLKMKMKIENCTKSIPKGNSYCRRKNSARGLQFKVLSEGLSTEIDELIRPPIQVLTEADAA